MATVDVDALPSLSNETNGLLPEERLTRTTNARLDGSTFFCYIATSIAGAILFHQATRGDGTAARLASIAAHAPLVRLTFVLALLTIFEALVLGVALYALTRDEDRDLALLALTCRVAEGVINAMMAVAMLALLSVAAEAATAAAPDVAASNALGPFLLRFQGWSTTVNAPVFAVGSTLYSYLFLRARSIPVPLAWLGMISSALLVMAVPSEEFGLVKGAVLRFAWLPLPFEVVLAFWLLIKGVAAPATRWALPLPTDL